jgi:hypothetical protein
LKNSRSKTHASRRGAEKTKEKLSRASREKPFETYRHKDLLVLIPRSGKHLWVFSAPRRLPGVAFGEDWSLRDEQVLTFFAAIHLWSQAAGPIA